MSLTIMLMLLSATLLFNTHPLTLGLNIILQTLTISMFMTMLMKNSWYSHILS